jgi:hypothetical protein
MKMANMLFIRIFFLVFIFGLGSVALINYIFDPLQYYRFSENKPLDDNDRWQVAAFIRNFPFDQVILGSSMTQNFSLDLTKNALDTHPIRLSISGLPIQEQIIVLNTAINTGKVKSVIWGFDRFYLEYEKGQFQSSFPIDLYKQNLKGHLSYLLNMHSLSSIRSLLTDKIKGRIRNSELESYNSWHDKSVFSKNNVMKLYSETENQEIIPSNQPLSESKIKLEYFKKLKQKIENFDRDVLSVIAKNPQIQFHIFYPPYSLAYQKKMLKVPFSSGMMLL